MGRYDILRQPAPASIFDFFGAALPLLLPIAIKALCAPALSMPSCSMTPGALALAGGRNAAPIRPWAWPRTIGLARHQVR